MRPSMLLHALLATAALAAGATAHGPEARPVPTQAAAAPAAAPTPAPTSAEPGDPNGRPGRRYLAQPLVRDLYFADPSAHVFDGRLYVYPSHDIDTGVPDDDLGSQYGMRDYRVLTVDRPGGPATVGPVALDLKDVPWASKQLWAPDAAFKDGTYFLYFPGRDKQGVFRIGVATSKSPTGPFKADPQPIRGSFSMDPAVFTDDDGRSYMYFGGIWGGQLQRWATGRYDPKAGDTDLKQDARPALNPKVAVMAADMRQFASPPRDAVILDEAGKPILGGDHERRFFEASWMFKRQGKYYFTYSTGDTHFVNYAIGDNPMGPFRYRGHVLLPVQGWTSHHSILPWNGRWFLFYHDTQLSNRNNLRSAKMTELFFEPDGSIRPVTPFRD